MTDKLDKLRSLVDKFSHNLEYMKATKNKYNESSCRNEYIDPFLEILGWDVTNNKGVDAQYREVIVEFNLSRENRPDYSLTVSGVPKLFVEAKKPAVNILTDPNPAVQARKYGWNAGHKIVVLTNFENLAIYDTTIVPHDGEDPTFARVKLYNYTEYVSKFDEINQFISRDSVFSGDFFNEQFPGTDHDTKSVDEYFLSQINEWRVKLANVLYKKGGVYTNANILNDSVQEFINQIVFLRICEDKNLPIYNSLQKNIKDRASLHSELKKMFKEADRRYNSGLFASSPIIFDLDNEAIEEIVRGLYYPQSPYLFNIIEPNMLGKMYEMFLTEELIIDGNSVKLAPKKDCKNRSIVTTPVEIVRYMVSKTLKPLCDGKTPNEVKKLKVADIACGSGIFLEESFQYLQDYCVNWYLKNGDVNHLEQIPGERYKLPLCEKKEILVNCLYGIDIDMHAVEVAKFSLRIKLIENETEPSVSSSKKILPDLSKNIFYGNALVDNNLLDGISLSESERMEIVPFDWDDMGVNGFDAIIGNPPYVSTTDMHNLLPDIEFAKIYKKKYTTSYKQFDKYFIFIERAISKLKNKGVLCYIVPNKFFKIESGKKLRGVIAEGKILKSLDDFGDAQLFSNKTIYSSILLIQKDQQQTFEYSNLSSITSLWDDKKKNSIELNEDMLTDDPWSLTPDIALMKLLKKVQKKSKPITDYVDLFNGIQTSAERPRPIYWFTRKEMNAASDNENIIEIERNGKKYTIEKEILRPFFKPVKHEEKGLNSYSILSTDKFIIFPYDENGKLIPISEMRSKYPGTMKYLEDNYNTLVPKSISAKGTRDVASATKDTWYRYGRAQALSAFTNTPKLIVGILSKEPLYAYDDKDWLIASGGTAGYCAIAKKEDSPYSLEYIQAWLTNPCTEKIVSIYGSNFENGFVSRGTSVLKRLPFIPLDLKDGNKKRLYDDVVNDSKEIYSINNQLSSRAVSKAELSVLERRKKELILSIEKNIGSIWDEVIQCD